MQELDEVVRLDLEMVIHSEQQLSWCLDYPGLFSGIWIKINSGMNRLGFTCENKRNVFQSKLTKKNFPTKKKKSQETMKYDG